MDKNYAIFSHWRLAMTEVSSLQMIAMKLESDEQVCFFFQIFFSFHSKVQKEALLALALICSVTGRSTLWFPRKFFVWFAWFSTLMLFHYTRASIILDRLNIVCYKATKLNWVSISWWSVRLEFQNSKQNFCITFRVNFSTVYSITTMRIGRLAGKKKTGVQSGEFLKYVPHDTALWDCKSLTANIFL